MTLLEKAKEKGVTIQSDAVGEWGRGCPYEHGLDTKENAVAFCAGHNCVQCYAREYKDPAASAAEGQRRFDTGAVRDNATGKGRYDLLPWGAIHALAQHCERGAIHYGERNVDKGIPQHSFLDSGIRHLSLYIQGDPEDHHLVAALWNIAWALEQELKRPELGDLPERSDASGVAW